MKKHILFDLDGTLIDPFYSITRCVEYALNKMGYTVDSLEELTKFIGPPLLESFSEFYNFSYNESKQAIDFYRERFDEVGIYENEPYEGIEIMLKDLSSKYDLYVATSKPTEAARIILNNLNLSSYFKYIGGSDVSNLKSTKTDVIKEVLAKNNITNHMECLMIGDRIHDVNGANNCSIDAVAVLYGYGSESEFLNTKILEKLGTVKQLHEYLKNGSFEK